MGSACRGCSNSPGRCSAWMDDMVWVGVTLLALGIGLFLEATELGYGLIAILGFKE